MTPPPRQLKQDPHRPYAFKSPLKTFVMRAVDGLGGMFFKSPAAPVPWKEIRHLAVLRLDHLGDVLMALSAVEVLRKALPGAQVDLFAGPWGKEAAEMALPAENIRVFEAPWFARPAKAGTWKGIKALANLLRDGKYDAVIDLRGDFRHHWAAWRAKIPVRIGQTLTGGGFLLTHPVKHEPGLHEVEQNLSLLQQAGIEAKPDHAWAKLAPKPEDEREAEKIRKSLGLNQPVICIHPVPGSPAKRWFIDRWVNLIEALPESFDIVLLGSDDDRPYLREIQESLGRKTAVAAGLFRLPVLAAFLKECRLFIGVDSGPAHVAAAVGTPVLSLFSGTNTAEQWAPRGPRMVLLQKKTECSPCELRECPLGNECMRQIEAQEVLTQVQYSLKG